VASTFESMLRRPFQHWVSGRGVAPRQGPHRVWRSGDGSSMKHAMGDGASHAVQPIQ